MPVKKRRKPKSKSTSRRKPRRNPCRSLVLIDDEPIRAEVLSQYHAMEKKIAKVRQDLNRFHSEDIPAFQQWVHATFGKSMSELRALDEEAGRLMELYDFIEIEAATELCGQVEAYRRVTDRMAAGEPPLSPRAQQEWDTLDSDFEARNEAATHFEQAMKSGDVEGLFPPGLARELVMEYLQLDENDRTDFEEYYQELTEQLEVMTGVTVPSLEELVRRMNDKMTGDNSSEPARQQDASEKPMPEPKANYVRLFRQIAKRLHPDSAKDLTEEQRNLWNDAQDAYQAKDEVRLSAVLARLDMAGTQPGRSVTIASILAMIQNLKNMLTGANQELQAQRREPAWRFSKSNNNTELERTIRSEFEDKIEDLRYEVADLKINLNDLKRRANPRPVSPRARKKRAAPARKTAKKLPRKRSSKKVAAKKKPTSKKKPTVKKSPTPKAPPAIDSRQGEFSF